MDHSPMPFAPAQNAASLFLREDGTMLVVGGAREIELHLTPAQLLQLGVDSLRLAVRLQPALGGEVAHVLATTIIEPAEASPCHSSLN